MFVQRSVCLLCSVSKQDGHCDLNNYWRKTATGKTVPSRSGTTKTLSYSPLEDVFQVWRAVSSTDRAPQEQTCQNHAWFVHCFLCFHVQLLLSSDHWKSGDTLLVTVVWHHVFLFIFQEHEILTEKLPFLFPGSVRAIGNQGALNPLERNLVLISLEQPTSRRP